MRQILAITKKELEIYFKSPMAYILLILILSIFNFFFFLIIDQNREPSLRDMFKLMEFLFISIIPLLTMKSFAEEKKQSTIEFLMTCPVKNTSIVLGKYLGSLAFFTIFIFLTIIYYGVIEYFSDPDRLAILAGYLGIWLEGAFLISIGIWTSSWTKNQMIAALTSYSIFLFLYLGMTLNKYLDQSIQKIISFLSFYNHTENFMTGLITLSDVVYFISGIVLFILLTRLSIDTKIWK